MNVRWQLVAAGVTVVALAWLFLAIWGVQKASGHIICGNRAIHYHISSDGLVKRSWGFTGNIDSFGRYNLQWERWTVFKAVAKPSGGWTAFKFEKHAYKACGEPV